MRTTLSIDDDVLAAARFLAEREEESLSEIISALARQGLIRDGWTTRSVRNGVPLLPIRRSGPTVTLELVNRQRDEQS